MDDNDYWPAKVETMRKIEADLRAENERLRAALKRYEDLEIHLSTGGKPDERIYTRKDVEMLVAVCRAGERAAFETFPVQGGDILPPSPAKPWKEAK